MIKVNKNKHKMYILNKLTENGESTTTIAERLQKIESKEGFAKIQNNITNMVIEATEIIEQGTPIYWGGPKTVSTKRELWKKLNEMGVYYTVPFWKLDKTIKEIIKMRKAHQALMDKEQRLIIKQVRKKNQ